MNNKGFTLSELLITLAIIAVLVIVSIPVFASQLEKSAESTDIENIKTAKSVSSAQFATGKDLDGNTITKEGFTCYFDATSGILTKSIPEGYGRGSEVDAGCEDTYMVVNPTSQIPQSTYTSKTDVENKYISVYINSEGTIKTAWEGSSVKFTNNDAASTSTIEPSEETTEDSFVPPSDATEFIMNYSNRTMAGFKTTAFVPNSIFEYDGTKYYFKGYEENSLKGYSGVVTIPNSVSYIGKRAFYTTNKLTTFNVIDNNKYSTIYDGKILLGDNGSVLIKATSKLGNCIIPEGVKEIYPGAFIGCSMAFRSITLPNSLEVIGEGAFSGCTYLQNITIPGGVKVIKYETIKNLGNNVILTLSEGVETIESGAIYVKGLDLSLPSTIKHLEADSIKLTSDTSHFSCTYKGATYSSIDDVIAAVNAN